MDASPRLNESQAGMPSPGNPWRSRGYLPHFDEPRFVQSLTFRLHDAVPEAVIRSWQAELAWVENLPATDPREIKLQKLVSRYEDSSHGACWLRDERIAALME